MLRQETQFTAVHPKVINEPALLAGFAGSTVCYAISSMLVYRRAPDVVSIVSTLCILLVICENGWNALGFTMAERALIVVPMAVNAGITIALLCGLESVQTSHFIKDCS